MNNYKYLILILLISLANAKNHVQSWDEANKATVIILGDEGKSKGTGFVWAKNNLIVTSLHVIANKKKITATYSHSSTPINCRVIKILPKHDLALLEVNQPKTNVFFRSFKSSDDSDERKIELAGVELHAFGYRGEKRLAEDIKVRSPNMNSLTSLRNLLGKKQQNLVRNSPILDLDIQVLNVQGHLRHGISGAPILNKNFEVVAVCAGGINEGTTEECYAIPIIMVKKIEPLGIANKKFRNIETVNTMMAFSGKQSSSSKKLKFGTTEFHYKKTVTLSTLLKTTADSIGSQQMINLMQNHWKLGGKDQDNIYKSRFDIFQNEKSGAFLTLPTNLNLTSTSDGYKYTKNGFTLKVFYETKPRIFDITNQQNLNQSVLSFDRVNILNDNSVQWQLDRNIMYSVWMFNRHGAAVYRNGYIGLIYQLYPNGQVIYNQWNQPMMTQKKYTFRTYAVKERDEFVILSEKTSLMFSSDWALLVLANQLSGFKASQNQLQGSKLGQ